MLLRKHAALEVERRLKSNPVVVILGPRQCGKTTLARQVARRRKETHLFDLEDPTALATLRDPMLALEGLKGLVIIDEVQRLPDLFPVLRVLSDRRPRNVRFLLLGSASRELIRQGSESLAGRISYLELTPFTLAEVGWARMERLWLRGGFPPSFLSKREAESQSWRQQYISTFLERDVPNLGITIPAAQLRRFWMMLSHYHGQSWNSSEIAGSMGTSDTTVRRYLDILTGTFMVRQLQPWFANIAKRQMKAPKIFFRDSGIFHSLIGVRTTRELLRHPRLGASWEGFAMEALLQSAGDEATEAFYWGVHGQGEVDLYFPNRGLAFELKHSSAPTLTASMTSAVRDLQLRRLTVIYPGDNAYSLTDTIRVLPLRSVDEATMSRAGG